MNVKGNGQIDKYRVEYSFVILQNTRQSFATDSDRNEEIWIRLTILTPGEIFERRGNTSSPRNSEKVPIVDCINEEIRNDLVDLSHLDEIYLFVHPYF